MLRISCFDKCCPENTKQGVECRKLTSSRTEQEHDFVLVLASHDMIKNAAKYPIAGYHIVVCMLVSPDKSGFVLIFNCLEMKSFRIF